MLNIPSFMIVSGNGRNSGKTSFVCDIIKAHRNTFPLTAIKVSPHFHQQKAGKEILFSGNGFNISIEKDELASKDTSRMLQEGAARVYYIEAKDEHLKEALGKLLPLIPASTPVICESAGMRDLLSPALFIMINRNDGRIQKEGYIKKLPFADLQVTFNGTDFDQNPARFKYDGNSWRIL